MGDSTDSSAEEYRTETGGVDSGALEVTGIYETSSGVVFYDSEEPLAWVQADNAVALTEMA